MSNVVTDILIVGGGAAGMSAALAASANEEFSVTVVDDNPLLGGQIWHAELGMTKSPEAAKLIDAITAERIRVINNAQLFDAPGDRLLAAETPTGRIDLEYKKLIIATGARELFLPFPGWTLPNVFGAGGLQAMVKCGLNIENKRVVVAGTGLLLLAVADHLRSKGAIIAAIAEQAPASRIYKFGLSLVASRSKMMQAVNLKRKLSGIPYLTGCWVKAANGAEKVETVTLAKKRKTSKVDCDFLAVGFHLVPNIELASLLGCRIENGFVAVDEFQRTSLENVYSAGEPTGIGGIDASLVEGWIAGLAASGNEPAAAGLFDKRDKTRQFARSLNRAFVLRNELKTLAEADTIVCRCEDVAYDRLRGFDNFREAKLQTRCGMGACQGRICGAATRFLFDWEPGTVRPPIFPVRMENL